MGLNLLITLVRREVMATLRNLIRIAKISKYTGLTKLCYRLNKGKKRIVAYHNVIPDKYFDDTLHLAHSMRESSFRRQVIVIKKRFDVDLNLENKNSLSITFDDGYLNQGKIAGEILSNENMKAYFFCAGILIDKKDTLVMDKLQYWFSYVPSGEYYLKELSLALNLTDKENRKESWDKLSKFIDAKLPLSDIYKYLDNIYKFKGIKKLNDDFYKLRFTSLEDRHIENMKANGHNIGAHSYYHERYAVLDDEKIKDDIKHCVELKNIFNTDVFCYPYGSLVDINEIVRSEIKNSGYKKALAYSNNPIKEGYNQYFMPRIFLPDTDNEALIDFILSGAKYFCNFKKLLPDF